jgi:hypothetical protein
MIDMHRNSPSKYNQKESMAIEKNDYSLNRHACSYEYQSIIAFLTDKIQRLLSSILEGITQLLNHENTNTKLCVSNDRLLTFSNRQTNILIQTR